MSFLRGTDWMIIARGGHVLSMRTSGTDWTRLACGLCVRGGRAYGNRDGFGGFGRGEHVAAAVEDGARFHYQAWRVNFAGHDGFGLNLNFAGGFYRAVKVAADNDVVAVNLAFDFSVLAEDHGLVGDQSPLHRGINAEGASAFQAAIELDAL